MSIGLNAQTMNYSLNHIGTNANGNLEMVLVATPDFTETNGNSSDMGVVVVLSGGAYLINTFENDCVAGPPPTGTVCDYAIPKVEWSETYLGTISSGTT